MKLSFDDFSSQEQMKDWRESVPWPIEKVPDQGMAWFDDPASFSIYKGNSQNPLTTMYVDVDNNIINIHSRGITRISVWLGQEMIDWTKPVGVNINGTSARGWRAKVLEPDIDVLLKDYRERGDRRMLYLQRLEFDAIQ